MPEANYLALLRQDMDRRSQRLKTVLRDERIRREFLKGVPNDEKKVVKAFVGQNQESALKTKPKVGLSALPFRPSIRFPNSHPHSQERQPWIV
jgi:hypothetical protein